MLRRIRVVPAVARLCAVVLLSLQVVQPAIARDLIIDPYYEYRDEVERGEFQYDDSLDTPWIENETEVLAPPEDEDLVAVDIDRLPPGMRVFIDQRRITVNPEDRVVRLWLVLKSDGGAVNGSFEGFRCEGRQYKVYAYSNPARKPPVSKAKRPLWRDAGTLRAGNYRAELLNDYFCGRYGTLEAHEIHRALAGDVSHDYFRHH